MRPLPRPRGAQGLVPLDPVTGLRLSNLLWYCLACGLAAALLQALLDGRPRGEAAAALAALLFAWHPVHAHGVAWVAGRKDVVSAALVFAALLLHLRARRGAPAAAVGAALCALLACLAKSTAVALPLLALGVEVLDPGAPPGAPTPWRRRLRHLLPLAVVCGLAALLAMWVGGQTGIRQPPRPLALVLVADLVVLRRYLVTAFVPWRLRVDHGELVGELALVRGPAALGDPSLWLQALLALAVLLPLALLAWRRRVVRAAAVWFLGGLLPVLNLVAIPHWIADRFLFLPALGPCLLLGWGLTASGRRSPRARRAALAAALVLLVAWGALAARRGLAFTSDERLWRAQLAVEPGSPLALAHLGAARLARAESAPDPAARDRLRAAAARDLEAALEGFATTPAPSPVHELEAFLRLARAHVAAGAPAAAWAALDRAEARFPAYPQPPFERGVLLARQGELEPALAAFARARERVSGAPLAPAERARWARLTRANLLAVAGQAVAQGGADDLALAVRALRAADRPDLAAQALERLAELDPDRARLLAD